MAITFVSEQHTESASGTSFTFTLGTTQAGDIMILEFDHNKTGNGTISGTTITTGGVTWTLKHSQLVYSNTRQGVMYWARATGDHSGQTVIASNVSSGGYYAANLVIYRGAVATGDPLAGATIVGEVNASGNETQAEITTTADNCMVCFVVANATDQYSVKNPSCTSPGALTVRATGYSNSFSISHCSSDTLKVTAGGTGAFTWSQTNAVTGSWAYAILPFVAAGPTNLKSYNTNLKANIKSINGNPIANVKSLNTNV